MVITVAPFTGWALTLLITLSKYFWHVLFRIGVHGKHVSPLNLITSVRFKRQFS